MSGPDPNNNTRLASLITSAKRTGFPKASIEAAIARGQGASASGVKLESVVIEAMLPPSVAVVIDCQSDNKIRTLQDIRLLVKQNSGTATPTSYLFTKAGKVTFEAKEGIDAEKALECLLDLDVMDLFEDAEGGIGILTRPDDAPKVIKELQLQFGLQIKSSDIVWKPNGDTMVDSGDETAVQQLNNFVNAVEEVADVQAVYTNALWRNS